jgi:hypothetical protein
VKVRLLPLRTSGSFFSAFSNGLIPWVKKERELEASVRVKKERPSVGLRGSLMYQLVLDEESWYHGRGEQESEGTSRTQFAGAVDVRAITFKRAPAVLADILLPRSAHVGRQELHSPPNVLLTVIPLCMCTVQWGQKAIGRKTTGTGRMRYLKDLPRRFKNGFQEGETSGCDHELLTVAKVFPLSSNEKMTVFCVM